VDYLGELAAVGTAVLWASNSVFLTLAGKRVGSQTVNAARLFLALGVMVLLHLVLYGTSCYESPSEIIKSSILIKQKWWGAEFRCRVS
jgi:drug/metabolite transporter (DMT)-like permease